MATHEPFDEAERPDMDLILWRHAEAEDGIPDAARALTKRGHRQARDMADWLKSRLPKHVAVVASPATRTRQTAEALELPFSTDRHIAVGASATEVLEAVGWPERRGALIVVGHQPTLGRVAALMLAGEEADWSIRKGALWWLTRRSRDGDDQVVLRAVMGPDLA
jgi:phosphohistidine phosphatase